VTKLEKELLRSKQELVDTKHFYEDRLTDLEKQLQKLQFENKRLRHSSVVTNELE
jgi:hypothetical protein